jgi:hypothetical protein
MATPQVISISGGAIPPSPARAEVVAPPPAQTLSLYAIEEQLLAYTDTADLVPEDQEQAFLEEFKAALVAAIDKRDRVGQFLNHLDAQAAFAAAEIQRLQERKKTFEAMRDRIESYVIRVIEGLGTDPKGKPKKLEGRTVTFSIRACPASVEIKDESEIPLDYKTAAIKLPARTWESLLDNLDLETRARITDQATRSDSVDKRAVKAAITDNHEIPGATLTVGKFSLVRK